MGASNGNFIPQTVEDKKLFLANEIAFQIRKQIKDELNYEASTGTSVNKTVAKIACGFNKPNG
jgi:nucleotidyltransferase/DNA polymerase involved in DNA repair